MTPAASSSESEKLRSVVVIVYVSPSVTVAARSPVMLGGSFAGVRRTVKLKVELEGVEESSLPSSTLTRKEADVVSEPSCSKETCPAAS